MSRVRLLGERVHELRERVSELEEWKNDTPSDSDEKHKRGQRQRIAETNTVWRNLTWFMTIVAGFLLGLTILTLMQNIPLQLIEREYSTSDSTIGRATGIFT